MYYTNNNALVKAYYASPMHLLLYGKHQCALSNKCLLKMCGNKHFSHRKPNFHLNSLLLRLFQCFSYNKVTKQQLIIQHCEIKKIIYESL